MLSFRYSALTQTGEVVSGVIAAESAAEVALRIEYLGLIPVDTKLDDAGKNAARFGLSFTAAPRFEEVTFFTGDLALLLRTGARINEALELVATDSDVGRLRPTIAKLTAAILGGESFADSLAHHPALFPPMYVALVRVGETSGNLVPVLEAIAAERTRAEALRRKVGDALRYPAFVLSAAGAVLIFFLTFVLPQFGAVLRDFNAKLDPIVTGFLALSDFFSANKAALGLGFVAAGAAAFFLLRRPQTRNALMRALARLPLVSRIMSYHQTAVFCRNLGVLLAAGVTLTATLRILADMMATAGGSPAWQQTVDRVRHGGKLSDALSDTRALPPMAVRTLRLGEDSGQLPLLAERIAGYYEVKLQRSLDKLVGVIGPLAIVTISIIVGGLIVSIMTALMSVSQVVG
ncbi:type II secretion system protein [Methylocella silvestris BL2]|uniref:Type II secretion system protein n=1 Tax=Methylocella silvestris (strain DSM 15510 / CIP 108128 / LMG 27833 / NCIMB 13906 / BL2) TaxID=395965 RepID=B8ESJ1_METSB|nr:type II secretion system F family protein [Methylocella silvestris]ACK49881.1 type II secretion system protein [Methylocella silvestris BL2]